jgi:hypothetical protein
MELPAISASCFLDILVAFPDPVNTGFAVIVSS